MIFWGGWLISSSWLRVRKRWSSAQAMILAETLLHDPLLALDHVEVAGILRAGERRLGAAALHFLAERGAGLRHGNPAANGQVANLLHEVDLADDQADRSMLVVLAGAVEDADVAVEVHALLVGIRRAHVVHLPGEAAREVAHLDARLALVCGVDVPDEVLGLLAREHRVQDLDLVGMLQRPELDAARVDERVRPGELELI